MSPDWVLFEASSLHFRFLQFLKCVWGIIEPFPDSRDSYDLAIDKRGWEAFFSLFPDHIHVSLNKVWILLLSQLVVMKFVVFDIPSFWKHPVEPVKNSVSESSGEVKPVVPSLLL